MAQGEREHTGSNTILLLLTAIVAGAFALRFMVFSTEELGLDGCLAVGLASIPVHDMLAFNLRDVHPPLFYLALRAWLGMVGTNFVAAKWLTIAAGVLTIPVLYQIARRTMGPLPGLLAALLLMASPAHIFLSPTVRDFAAGMLLSLLSTLVLLSLVDAHDCRRQRSFLLSLCLALTTGSALLTWYFHGLHLFLQAAYLIVLRPRRSPLAGIALLGGTLVAAPWLAYALTPLLGKALGVTSVSGEAPRLLDVETFGRETATSVVGSSPVPWAALLAWWGLLLLLGAGYGAFRARYRPWATYSFAGTALGLGLVYLVAGLWVHGVFFIRYLLIPLPFAILAQAMLTAGSSAVWRKVAVTSLIVLLIPAALWYAGMSTAPPIPYNQDPVSLLLEPQIGAGDAVIFTDIARLGFYRLRNPNAVPSYSVHFAGAAYLEDDVEARSRELLPALLANHKRIWLVNSATYKGKLGTILKEALGRTLAERIVLRNDSTDTEVVQYRAPAGVRQAFAFGDAIKFEGYEIRGGNGEFAPGEAITIDLVWRAAAPVTRDFVVSLQILDGGGHLVAQSDGPPANGRAPTSTWQAAEQIVDTRSITIPDKPGAYTLGVAMYELPSVQRLAVANTTTNLVVLQSIGVKQGP